MRKIMITTLVFLIKISIISVLFSFFLDEVNIFKQGFLFWILVIIPLVAGYEMILTILYKKFKK